MVVVVVVLLLVLVLVVVELEIELVSSSSLAKFTRIQKLLDARQIFRCYVFSPARG